MTRPSPPGLAGGGVEVLAVTDEGLGNTSWVVDLGDGRALVVDPARDPGPYLEEAGRRALQVAFSAETHLHADFVTGSRELAAVGATVLAPAAAGLAWPHRPLADGEQVDLGGLVLEAMATPGHTPEHMAWLLLDGSRPVAVFTGGALIVGGAARTDLISPERTEELTRDLYGSIVGRLLGLPDDLPVYPTHGAGSFCSAAPDGRRWTTIGDERRANPLLAAPDEDAFVAALLGRLVSYPPYFLRLREVNRTGPRVHRGLPGLAALGADDVARLVGEGAVVVDARPVRSWAGGHVPGALSVALRPGFSTWLGWLVHDPEGPLVFVLEAGQDRAELVRQCLGIGYERLAGELAGGMAAWQAAGRPVARTPVVDAADLGGRAVLDVRQAAEYHAGHVPGAGHTELGALSGAAVDDRPVATMCGHGERAATAASVLERAGKPDVAVVVGGPDDWARSTGRELAR